ncbi:MAG TPA: methylenetetrahydrofolate reductase [NAD(P)H] [Candidatus Gastranaerophilales bacterium]|nr:methylenetetrahydrofolate reductase [NAD(P)H] [Candidatus Gastranaerophilales bacterium]
MKLKEIYNSPDTVISFEVFPPKSLTQADQDSKIEALTLELKSLSKYNPSFISVTYGAGGSTRETTLNLVLKIKKELNIQPMPHFTCVGSTKSEILQYIKQFEINGINNILALRGDPPKGEGKFVKLEDGFGYANELVEFIKSKTDLGIGVAGYPECHQECCSLEVDIQNLKRKVESGAEAIITQLFYVNDRYFDFVEKAQRQGINVPIIPGILPVTSYNQIEKTVTLAGCELPADFKQKLEKHKDNAEAIKQIGLEFAASQCRELIRHGTQGMHFYTLNKAFAVDWILKELEINTKNEYTGV